MTHAKPLPNADDIKRMRRALARGATVTQVAQQYGVSRRWVTNKTGATSKRGNVYLETKHANPGAIVVQADRLHTSRPANDLCLPRRCRISEAIAHWRDRGLSDAAIARELRLSSSLATEYGLAVRSDVADPFGTDPRRHHAEAAE